LAPILKFETKVYVSRKSEGGEKSEREASLETIGYKLNITFL
jgi:hypothetical protein